MPPEVEEDSTSSENELEIDIDNDDDTKVAVDDHLKDSKDGFKGCGCDTSATHVSFKDEEFGEKPPFDPIIDLRITKFRFKNDTEPIVFKESYLFNNVFEFRNALRDYTIIGGYKIKRIHNDPIRVSVRCAKKRMHLKDSCIYCSRQKIFYGEDS